MNEIDLVGETEEEKGIFINGISYLYSINKLINEEELLIIKLYDPNSNSKIEFTYEAPISKLTKDIKILSSCGSIDEVITSLNEVFSMRNANVEEKDGEYFLKLIFVRSGIRKNYSIPLIKHEPQKPKSKIEKNLDKIENKLNDLAKKFEQLKTEKEESIKNKVKEIFNKDIKKVLFQEIEKFVESKANYGNKKFLSDLKLIQRFLKELINLKVIMMLQMKILS